jgi:hypothetical protein
MHGFEVEEFQGIGDLGVLLQIRNSSRVGEEIMSGIGSWKSLKRLHARISMVREGSCVRLMVRVKA